MPWSEDYLATGITIIDTKQRNNSILSLNISLCQITGLEVYRGKTNVFEIKHSGFTLMDRNTIQVILLNIRDLNMSYNLLGGGG